MLSARFRPVLTRRPLPRLALPALLLVVGGGALTGLASQAAAQDDPAPSAAAPRPAPLSADPVVRPLDEENLRASRSRSRVPPEPVAAPAPPPPPPPPPPVVVPVAPPPAPPPPKPTASKKPSPTPSASPSKRAAAPAPPPPPPPPAPVVRSSGGRCPVPNATFTDTWGAARSGGRSHQGTDLMAPSGSPVYAVVDGVVRTASSSAGGISLYLTADNGTEYFYAHNSANVASTGQRVTAGQLIAKVGATGNAPDGAPHVHFEMHPGGGGAVNPYSFLRSIC